MLVPDSTQFQDKSTMALLRELNQSEIKLIEDSHSKYEYTYEVPHTQIPIFKSVEGNSL